MLKGHLDAIVLAALEAGPAHGYAIIETIKRSSASTFDLPEGTVYPALHRLEAGGSALERLDDAARRSSSSPLFADQGRLGGSRGSSQGVGPLLASRRYAAWQEAAHGRRDRTTMSPPCGATSTSIRRSPTPGRARSRIASARCGRSRSGVAVARRRTARRRALRPCPRDRRAVRGRRHRPSGAAHLDHAGGHGRRHVHRDAAPGHVARRSRRRDLDAGAADRPLRLHRRARGRRRSAGSPSAARCCRWRSASAAWRRRSPPASCAPACSSTARRCMCCWRRPGEIALIGLLSLHVVGLGRRLRRTASLEEGRDDERMAPGRRPVARCWRR